MTQLSSTASSCATQWKMWHLKVFSVIYFIAVCAAQDASNVTKAYGKTPESTVLPTGPPPVPSLQSQSPLDVFPSEKVEFNCSVSGSSKWTFAWKVNGHPVNDADPNLSLDGEGSKLTIKASQAHSGSYVCQGHDTTNKVTTADSNSLKLNVYENKPKPTVVLTPQKDKLFPGESVTFKCTVNVFSAWEYLWYHNGSEIQGFNSDTYKINSIAHPHSGQYRCKAKRGKEPFFTEESETTTLQVSDPPTPSLKVRTPWLDVFYTENVEMSCEVESSFIWTFIWFRDGQHVNDVTDLELEEDGSSLNITSATQTHQGVYTCKAQLESGSVTSGDSNPAQVIVYDNTPKPTLSKDPGLNPMYVGENVKFTCKVNVSTGWEYQWYKDAKKLTDTSETIDIRLGPSDGGKYSCKASRGGIKSAHSDMMTQDVLEIPVPTLELNTQWLDVFPTESVKFSCKMQNNLDWTYTWYRDGQPIQTDNRKATLSINSASDSDAGQYQCKGHLSGRSVNSSYSSGFNLRVYVKKPSVILTQDPEYKVMFAGESVSFSCHINVPSEWEYQWFKDGTELNETSNKYSIRSVAKANSGSYTCRAKRGKDKEFHVDFSQAIKLEVRENKPKPSVIRQPSGANVYTGESVSFKCELEIPSGWRYSWYKDEEHLPHTNSSFEIHNATSLNNGTYKCNATRDKTGFQSEHSDEQILRISEIPVPLVKKGSPWLDVFPNESVSLTCGMSEIRSEWRYIWYRDGQVIQSDDAVTSDPDGTLSIRSASASHRGQYSCSGKFKRRNVTSNPGRTVTLRVYDTKPSIKLMQRPHSKVMHTGDEVFFSCHVNVSSGWEYLFYKDGNPLVASGNNYSIRSVLTTDTGSYECKAKRGKEKVFEIDETQASRLDIEERPSTAIVLLTGWSEVFSTDSLILKCEVKEGQYAWNYTWSKEGEPINQTFSEKYTVTPHNNPEQSLYTCRGVRTARPFYSKDSQSFATKNLLLKRRVLLSISGCLFFGIIAVFIGCIALRVFHKPVDEYEKPEEAELFLTMAQLKDRGDAPSPMVDYVTDEALNAPSKEGEENGKICSESTPLPITSPEDEAATAENPDTAENGGGLVSFKQ